MGMGMEDGGADGMNRASWSRAWTERGPAPLDLTDAEILDWLDEYCDQAVYNRPTPEYRGGFTLYCYDIRTNGPTLRQAVCLAAARWKEANE
jgi:hypothetical protein